MQAPDAVITTYAEDLTLINAAAKTAGDIAMRYFGDQQALDVKYKQANSPVSAGDFAVDTYLRETLLEARPDYGWLSEETTDDDPQHRLNAKRTFIVDPIDGTRAYINGGSCWCVSIAVVEGDRTIAGVLVCPVLGETYAACLGGGATINAIALKMIDNQPASNAIAGRGALVERLALYTGQDFIAHGHVPSLAYRIAMTADGRLGGTFIRSNSHDWDIAAAALILREVGGDMVAAGGKSVTFNGLNAQKPAMVASQPALLDAMLRVADS